MKPPRPKPLVQEPSPPMHSFSKNGHYENMKGPYEVLSIDGGTMRIRWESGEETDTDIKLQDRILSRFEREWRAAKAARRNQKEQAEFRLGEHFRGLSPTDFTLEVAKTNWRSRTGGLGGLVTQELDGGDLCFGSWVPFCKPEIHWADVDQRNRRPDQLQTGFFCRLDEAGARYGMFLERSSEADGKGDWHRALDWLAVPEHEEWLRSLAAGNGLRIFDPQETPSFPGFLQASEARWLWVQEELRTDVPSLNAFLVSLPPESRATLECAAWVPKDRAVGRTVKIGRDIAALLELLMPLYRASVGAGEPRQGNPARRRTAN